MVNPVEPSDDFKPSCLLFISMWETHGTERGSNKLLFLATEPGMVGCVLMYN